MIFYKLCLDDTMTLFRPQFSKMGFTKNHWRQRRQRNTPSMVAPDGGFCWDHVAGDRCAVGRFCGICRLRNADKGDLSDNQPKEQVNLRQRTYRKRRFIRRRWSFKLQDYRDERGTYGVLPASRCSRAVGEQYWGVLFQSLHDCS